MRDIFTLNYRFTNESLEAITKALSIREDDSVISICGSGAQPFALLENLGSGRVLAIDYNPEQIKFAKRIGKLIKDIAIEKLAELNIAPQDKGYFSDKSRIEAIRRKLDRIDFRVMDITQEPTIEEHFSKGYFSNAHVNLKAFHRIFKQGAIVYLTAGTFGSENEKEISKLYDLDEKRTRLACRTENRYNRFLSWTPRVFIRK